MSETIDRLNAALGGRYSIERELGAGGTATVYLAEDSRHHRKVAVPVLDASISGGTRNRDIAIALGISEKTIKIHRTRVMKKMGAESLADLIRVARAAGIETPEAPAPS